MSRSRDETTILTESEVVRTTERAILVRLRRMSVAESEDVWIPRSVVEGGEFLEEGDTDVEVHDWWAYKNDLI